MNAYDTNNYETILSGSTLEFYDQAIETSTTVLRVAPDFDKNTLHIESFKNNEFVSSIFIGGDIRANIIEVNELHTWTGNTIQIYNELTQMYTISFDSKINNSFITKNDILQHYYNDVYINELINHYYTKDQITTLLSNYYQIEYINTEFSKYSKSDLIASTYANIEWVNEQYYSKSNIDSLYYKKNHIDEIVSNIENNHYIKQYINHTFANIDWVSREHYTKPFLYTQQEIHTHFYNKQTIDDTFANINISSDDHYTKSDIDVNFYTKSEIISIIANTSWESENPYLQTYIDLNYYNRTIIDSRLSNITSNYYDKANVDATFYTKEQVDTVIANIDFVSDRYYDKANVNATFYTKEQADTKFANIEFVSSQIMNDFSQNANEYISVTEANETFFKKEDLFVNNTYIQEIEANVDIYQTNFKNIVFADVTSIYTDYIIVTITTSNIRFTIKDYKNDRLFKKGNVFFCNHDVYAPHNEEYVRKSQYYGVYDILLVEYSNLDIVISCNFHATMSNVSDFIGTAIMVKPNNTTYVVTSASNQENLYIIQPLHDVQYGSIAHQPADNVHITGGVIQCPVIHVNEIKAIDGQDSISIRLPTSDNRSSFFVKADSVETNNDLHHDVVFGVDGSGLVSAYQFNSLSDRRLKKNEAVIQNPLDLVRKLKGKTFDWKDETKNKHEGHKQYGFIAQEVASEFPTLVNETIHEYLAVDYSKVVSILVESVKILHDTVIQAGLTHDSTNNNMSSCNCGSIITPALVHGPVKTNIVSFGEIDKQITTVRMASTSNDLVTVTPLFNQGDYTLYSNQGKNTLDGKLIEIHDTIVVKDCVNNAFNGVYTIVDTQEGEHGIFSKCIRHERFTNHGNIHGSTIIVEPSGMHGNGKGQSNPGQSFLCTVNSNIDAFVLDSTPVEFVQFTSQIKGTLAEQNYDNVYISGGTISIPALYTSEIRTHNSNVVSVHLDSPSTTFSITNSNYENVCIVDAQGKVTASDYFSPSDMRLKTNVNNIQNALSLVRKLTGVTFDWKDETKNELNHKQYGFIAQDVATHFPTLVHESNNRLSVDYAKTVAILVEAVKELGDILNL